MAIHSTQNKKSVSKQMTMTNIWTMDNDRDGFPTRKTYTQGISWRSNGSYSDL